ncbi:MAG: hypothetical protein ACREF7_03335, partial [Candidatus Saccharimonadales bacterium]
MSKLTIGVIFGSRSAEHDISIVTAIASIIKPLEMSGKYNVVAIYIDKQGKWYSHPKLKEISLYTSGQIDNFLLKLSPLELRMGGKLELVSAGSLGKRKVQSIDVAFPATHG